MRSDGLVMVTGSSGFVGKQLVKELLKKGHKVRAVSRKCENLSCETVNVGDINSRTDWSMAVRGVETVIHLAGETKDANPGSLEARQLYKTNAEGLGKLSMDAAKYGVTHMIYLSSVGAVGEESSDVLNDKTLESPRTEYGKSKLAGERLLKWISESSALRWTILRAPLIYGPKAQGNFAKLVRVVKKNVPLPLLGVKNRKSILYLNNCCQIIGLCINNPSAHMQCYYPSDMNDISTPELIKQIHNACVQKYKTNDRLPLFYCPNWILWSLANLPYLHGLKKLISSFYVDSSKAKIELGFSPLSELKKNISDSI